MKFLETRVLAYEMMALFIVLSLIDDYALEVEDLWGYCYEIGVNLFKHLYKISLQQEILFQRHSYDICLNDVDIVSCEWILELFVNSWDGAFIKTIERKYETLDELEQGGIAHLNIEFDEMFNMSNVVIPYLHDLIKKFYKYGIAKVPNENFVGSDSENE